MPENARAGGGPRRKRNYKSVEYDTKTRAIEGPPHKRNKTRRLGDETRSSWPRATTQTDAHARWMPEHARAGGGRAAVAQSPRHPPAPRRLVSRSSRHRRPAAAGGTASMAYRLLVHNNHLASGPPSKQADHPASKRRWTGFRDM